MPEKESITVELEPAPTSAYSLLSEIHEALHPDTSALTPEELEATGVRVTPHGKERGTQQLYVPGTVDGRRAYQSLSLSKRGIWTFCTVFSEPGGSYTQRQVASGSPSDSDPNIIREVEHSLFNERLAEILDRD